VPKRQRTLRIGIDDKAAMTRQMCDGGELCAVKVLLPTPPLREAKVITFIWPSPLGDFGKLMFNMVNE
jgi:hypothetical protein